MEEEKQTEGVSRRRQQSSRRPGTTSERRDAGSRYRYRRSRSLLAVFRAAGTYQQVTVPTSAVVTARM